MRERGVYRTHRRLGRALLGHLRDERGRERAPPADPEPAERRRSRLVARRTQAGVRPCAGRAFRHLRRRCGWKRAAQARSRHRLHAGSARPAKSGFGADPAWSPDGRKIAFMSNREGDDDIFVVNADGSGLRNLTRSQGHDRTRIWKGREHKRISWSSPDEQWSPDGRKIVFRSERDRPSELERAACRPRCRARRDLRRQRRRERASAADTQLEVRRHACVVARWAQDRVCQPQATCTS